MFKEVVNKQEVLELRDKGIKQAEIARMMGCSRSRIGQICGGKNILHKRSVALHKDLIYPNIARWLFENQVSMAAFCQSLDSEQRKKSYARIVDCLHGKHRFNISEIKKIMKITDMTFEEAFEEADDVEKIEI